MKTPLLPETPWLNFLPIYSRAHGTFVKQIDFADKKINVPFKIAVFTVEPGSESKLDIHRVKELWMVVEGTGVVEYQGRELRTNAGDILYFDSFATHKIYNVGKQRIKLISIWWE